MTTDAVTVAEIIDRFEFGEHMKMLTRLIELRGVDVKVFSSRSKGWTLTYLRVNKENK